MVRQSRGERVALDGGAALAGSCIHREPEMTRPTVKSR
jgi:hypothetical protein